MLCKLLIQRISPQQQNPSKKYLFLYGYFFKVTPSKKKNPQADLFCFVFVFFFKVRSFNMREILYRLWMPLSSLILPFASLAPLLAVDCSNCRASQILSLLGFAFQKERS